MTPDERRKARERCEKAAPGPWSAEGSGCCGPAGIVCKVHPVQFTDRGSMSEKDADFVAHARTDLPAALDQIDADERLMGRAIEALVVGGDYQADAWNDAKKLCADHGWHRVDAEKIQVAIDALRTRLGEERVEPIRGNLPPIVIDPYSPPKVEFQVGQWFSHPKYGRGRVVPGILIGEEFKIQLVGGRDDGMVIADNRSWFKPCSPVCTAEQTSIGVGDKVRVDDVPAGEDGVPCDFVLAGKVAEVIDTKGRFGLRLAEISEGVSEVFGTNRWNIASIIERGPDGPGGK